MEPKTVLLVEDEPAVAELLYEILEAEGYRVVLAANGEEGLARVHETAPDLILTDVMMPGINGHQLCQALSNDARFEAVPIVLMSAARDKAICEGCQAAGFIPKPFTVEHVVELVASLVASAKGTSAKVPR